MRSSSAAAAGALLLALSACASESEADERYWVEGEHPLIIRGPEVDGGPDILETPGTLRYEPESGCFFLQVAQADGDTILETVVWHMDAVPVVEGDRVGVATTGTRDGTEVTVWDGDLLGGYFGVPSTHLEEIDACAAQGAISVFRVDSVGQDRLRGEQG